DAVGRGRDRDGRGRSGVRGSDRHVRPGHRRTGPAAPSRDRAGAAARADAPADRDPGAAQRARAHRGDARGGRSGCRCRGRGARRGRHRGLVLVHGDAAARAGHRPRNPRDPGRQQGVARVMRRLVIDFADRRPLWRVPDWAIARIAAALPAGWEVRVVEAPADGAGDGAQNASAEALEAVADAEVYLGFGVSAALLRAGRGLRWVHTGTAGVATLLTPELVESDIAF